MKKLLLIFAFFISGLGFSQIEDNWEEKSELLPGYVITNDGQKVVGQVEV